MSAGRPAGGVRQQGADQFFGQPLATEWSGSGRPDIATRNEAGFGGAMEGHGLVTLIFCKVAQFLKFV